MRATIVVMMLATATATVARAEPCPPGQKVGADTAGHCCWPEQAWSNARQICVGVPQCPAGFEVRGEACVARSECPVGQAVTDDTHGHCCWIGQVWSMSRAMCVGIPQCPPGLQVQGETCVRPAGAPTPPPPAPPTYTPAPPQPQPLPPPTYSPSPAPSAPEGMEAVPTPPGTTPSVATPTTAPPPASLPKFPMRFEAGAGDVYRVRADGKSCMTPCTLELPPGDLQVHVDAGARELDSPLKVPGMPSTITVTHPSRAHYGVGAGLLALGLADTAVGLYFAVAPAWNGHEAVGAVNVVLGTVASIVGIVELVSAGRARLSLKASTVALLGGAP